MKTLRLVVTAIVLLSLLSVARAQLTTTGVGSSSGGGGGPTCNGTLDLSTGCVVPGLGG